VEHEEVCDIIRHREVKIGRENSPSAIVAILTELVLAANDVDSARFEIPRKEAKTICEGLFDGQIFESSEDKADDACSGGRNAGPPTKLSVRRWKLAGIRTHLGQCSQELATLAIELLLPH